MLFFQALKRSRPPDSENIETIDNRPSKLSTPIRSIWDSNSSNGKTNGDNLNNDSHDEVLSITNFSVEDGKILSIEYGDDVLSTESLFEIAKYLKHSLYLSFRILQLSQILSTFLMNDIKMSEKWRKATFKSTF